ncbi:Sec23-binding domain of Sec16-domain-containing protein [Flammula alnicola]|nr:Sec23-binding domain of Sec16-domain-containing protein [Flammula alnicola]
MNGVEAAASLFGSEDSGSDLFATLGAETTSPQLPANDPFLNNTSSLAPQTEAYDFSSEAESNPGNGATFLEYPQHTAETRDHTTTENVPYNQTQNGFSELGQWNGYEQNSLGSAYTVIAASNTQAIDPLPSTTTTYNHYVPSTYSPEPTAHSSYDAYDPPAPARPAATHSAYGAYNHPAPAMSYSTTYGAYDPHAPAPASATTRSTYDAYDLPTPAATHSAYGAYDPPAPSMTRSSYAAYDPPAPNVVATQLAYGTYDPPSYHKTESSVKSPPKPANTPNTSTPQYSDINAVPTPTKSTITRPKVSNAYDPPFIPTLPSRRSSRPGGAQQAYAQYQKPAELYYAPPEASSAYSGVPYQQPTLSSDVGHPFAQISSDAYLTETSNTQPSTDGQHYVDHGYPQASPPHTNLSDYNMPHSVDRDQTFPVNGVTGQAFSGDGQNGTQEFVSSDEFTEPLEAIESSVPLPAPADSPSTSPQAASKSSIIASPSSIPLPYSPPIEDIQGYEAASSSSTDKFPSHQSTYNPQLGPRKDAAATKEVYDPYAPKLNHNPSNYIPRTSSPLSLYSGRQNETRKLPANAPSNLNSVGSPPGSIPRPLTSTVGPANLHKRQLGPSHDDQAPRQMSQLPEGKLAPQEIVVKATAAQYAPSPSLIGANDPLSRTSARAPVVTFGFGGKMITCFHGMPGLNAGFDIAFSSRTSSELKIRTLHKILPELALNSSESSYPGPLLSDPGATSISLVRPNLATQTKTKKTAVLSYLTGRISEIQQGLGYLANAEKQAAENKLILVKLLSVMVENDGHLLGTQQSESAVRSTLVPRLDGTPALQDAVSLQASFKAASSDETPISVTTLRSSSLDKIEEFLLQGDRRQAYQFAMEEKLWAHALIIASSIDKESWKDVVHDFLRVELGLREEAGRGLHAPNGNLSKIQPQKNNRESLRVAYSLFSGQGAAAVQELAPISLLQSGVGRFQPPMVPTMTPRTPNFAPMQHPIMPPSIPSESLAKWAETAAMIISSPLTPEASAALTALGDQLLANNWVEAAHVCYLLSPQTSLIGGLGSPSARITLVGSRNPADVTKDSDALIFSEILEFALSLVPTVKGQEPFHGIPHLQAYRFIRAVSLAETGDIQLANRYCDAITASLSHTSPYTNLALLEQLQGLQQRLSGVFPGDKSGSWIGGKLTKPSLDSIGGWLEGRFTKLVTGESDSATPTNDNPKSSDQPFNGPFAHYSTISSNTPSARSSPQPPSASLNVGPPQRTTSAMATATPYSQQVVAERSSSAMGYMRQRPAVQTHTATSNSISSSQSSPVGFGFNDQPPSEDPYAPKSRSASNDDLETPIQTIQTASWWGSSTEANGSNNTPTAATFMRVDESSIQATSDGFISLMDNNSFSIGPVRQQQQSSSMQADFVDDDDLGLGNSKPQPEKQESSPVKEEAATPPPKSVASAPEKTETPASTGSWLGRWWKKSDSSAPGPIKASLGEESAFYYDKEQKRWINRNAAADDTAKPPAAAAPPPRAQTASPGMTGSKPQPHAGPPLRSASAVDLGEPPVKAPMRIRSNLAPPTESAPSTPTGTRLNPSGPPPPARPKSQATKRNIRSRYVDVFQQETGGAA